jgi:hypothetical protein
VDLGMAVLLFLGDLMLVLETVETVLLLMVAMVQMLYRAVDLVAEEEVKTLLLQLIAVATVVLVSFSSHILHKYSKNIKWA